ncbi:MAG: 5-formyltetrahydrofolate cyclo-ligase [Salinivirgaceae bacterium]|nr:MAG: 5-formyltetrahydrofolate cyclo-ligase [Salinivirgaceae bacterium]
MMQAKKKEVRKQVRVRVKELSENVKKQQADAVFVKIETLPEFKNANIIMHYWSLSDEILTHECIKKWAGEKQILLPVIEGEELIIREFTGIENMQPDPRFSIPEPTGEAIQNPRPDIIIIPGVAFDSNCNRLGRGKGFYDRFLAKHQLNVILIGVCFDEQIVPEVPTESHDFKLYMVFSQSNKFQ